MTKQRIENEPKTIAEVINEIKASFDFDLAREWINKNELQVIPENKLKYTDTGLSHSIVRTVDEHTKKLDYCILSKGYIGCGEYGKIRLVFALKTHGSSYEIRLEPRLFKSWGTTEEPAENIYEICHHGIHLYSQYYRTANPIFFRKKASVDISSDGPLGIYQDMPLLAKDFKQWLREYYDGKDDCPFELADSLLEEDATHSEVTNESLLETKNQEEKKESPGLFAMALSLLPTISSAPIKEEAETETPLISKEKNLQQSSEVRKLLHICIKLMQALHDFHMKSFKINEDKEEKSCFFVHRDIKPDNLVYDEKKDVATLLDLDFAIPYTGANKVNFPQAGSIYFMAPDSYGRPTYKTDYYAMAAVIALTLHGKNLFAWKINARGEGTNDAETRALITQAPYHFHFPHLQSILATPFGKSDPLFAGMTNYQALLKVLKLLSAEDHNNRLNSIEQAQYAFQEIQFNLLKVELSAYFSPQQAAFVSNAIAPTLNTTDNKWLGLSLPKLIARLITLIPPPEDFISEILTHPEFSLRVNNALSSDSYLKQRFAKNQLLHTSAYFASLSSAESTPSKNTIGALQETRAQKKIVKSISEIIQQLEDEVERLRAMAVLEKHNYLPGKRKEGVKKGKASFIEKDIIPKMKNFEKISDTVLKLSREHVGFHYYLNKIYSVETTTEKLIGKYNKIIIDNQDVLANMTSNRLRATHSLC